MILIIKNVSGVDFEIENKAISLKGNAFLNEISNNDFELLLKNDSFKKMLDSGFIIENKSNTENIKSDIAQDIAKEQDKAQATQAKRGGVRTKRL